MFIAAFGAANTIGGIPLIVAIVAKTAADPSLVGASSDNLADMSGFGIEPNLALVLIVIPFIIGLYAVYLLMKPLHGRSFLTLINGGLHAAGPGCLLVFSYGHSLWLFILYLV